MSHSTLIIAMLVVGAASPCSWSGFLCRVREREEQLADILDLPYGERDVDVEA